MVQSLKELVEGTSGWSLILLVVFISVLAHLLVLLVRRLGEKFMSGTMGTSFSKAKTIASLVSSVTVFSLYFAAVGFILNEAGVSIKAYLASASIIGLAIGFGSQNFVQDVVSGLTVIFSDLFDIGEMVEISGQTGIVKSVGLRYTVLENSMGAEIFIPNRKIENVVNYPRGYVRCLVDVTLSKDSEPARCMTEAVESMSRSVYEQFPGVVLRPPSIGETETTVSGKRYMRVKFRLWPGRGDLIERNFKPEVVQALKSMDPLYADWMVSVNFEVEKRMVQTKKKAGRPEERIDRAPSIPPTESSN